MYPQNHRQDGPPQTSCLHADPYKLQQKAEQNICSLKATQPQEGEGAEASVQFPPPIFNQRSHSMSPGQRAKGTGKPGALLHCCLTPGKKTPEVGKQHPSLSFPLFVLFAHWPEPLKPWRARAQSIKKSLSNTNQSEGAGKTGSYCHLAGRSQGRCQTPCSAQVSPHS